MQVGLHLYRKPFKVFHGECNASEKILVVDNEEDQLDLTVICKKPIDVAQLRQEIEKVFVAAGK